MEETETVAAKRFGTNFGDEQSALFDQFERLTFEIQLNQAILGRSLSEPQASRFRAPPPPHPFDQPHRRQSKLFKAFKKLLKPIFFRKSQRSKTPDANHIQDCRKFTRSLSRLNFKAMY